MVVDSVEVMVTVVVVGSEVVVAIVVDPVEVI